MTERLTIFVSSPGDVAEERAMAQRVIERLQGELAGRVRLQPIFWEHEPLLATASFQDQIVQPSETDIVVCVLWSRLGTRLPRQFRREDGSRYDSGTEYEFEDAVRGREANGKPDLLVYRKLAEPVVSLRDRDSLLERLRQKDLLESFFERWFKDEEEGTLTGAFHAFEGLDRFEQLLELHLRKLIEPVLAEQPVQRTAPPPAWQQGSPFRGLEPFSREHAAVFFGRTKAVGEVLAVLRKRASEAGPFVLITGMSGCGKSSLARAGVVPLLIEPGVVEGVGHWRVAMLRPGDTHEGEDLLGALARSLSEALPELEDGGTDPAAFSALLRSSAAGTVALVRAALSQAGAALQRADSLDERPQVRLCLVLDQLEEAFTDGRASHEDRLAFFNAVEALVDPATVWVVATLRSDFYPRCAEVPALMRLKEGGGQYDLALPSPAEIGQIIRQPALAAGLSFEEEPTTGVRLEDLLRDAAIVDTRVLPLLEFTLEELYRDRTEAGLLQLETYRRLGGVEGALALRAEEVFQQLSPSAQEAFAGVMRALVTVGHTADDPATASRAERATFTDAASNELIDALVAARLLVTDLAVDGGVTLRVAHEALLRHWPRLTEWLERDHAHLRARARLASAAQRWHTEGRTSDFLLQPGKPLDEALAASERAGRDLTPTELDLVRASVRASRQRVNMKRVGVGALAVLTVLALVAAAVATQQSWTAQREARTSERVQDFMLGLFQPANPELGLGELTAAEMLDLGVGQAEIDLADEPAALARLYVSLGHIQLRLGRPADAEGLFQRALELRRELFGEGTVEVAEAQLGLGAALRALGKPDQAEPLVRQGVAIRRRGYDDGATGEALALLANVLSSLGRYEEAEAASREALELRTRAFGEVSQQVAAALNDLASVRAARGDRAGAVQLSRDAVARFEQVEPPESPWLAGARGNLAFHLQSVGEYAEAEAMMREALERHETTYGPDHPIVANDLSNLAAVLEDRRAFSEAEPLLVRAHDIHLSRYGAAHPQSLYTLNNLAGLYRLAGDVRQALPLSRQAVELSALVYGPDHPDVGTMKANLGGYLTEVGELDEAQTLIDDAVRIHTAAYGPDDPRLAVTLGNAATLAHERHDLDTAEALHRRVLGIYRKAHGDEHADVAFAELNLATVLVEEDRVDEAIALTTHARDVYVALHGEVHPDVGAALHRLGELLDASQGAAAAEPVLVQAYEVLRATLPDNAIELSDVRLDLAQARIAQDRPGEAVDLVAAAVAAIRETTGPRTRATGGALITLGSLQQRTGDHAGAEATWAEVVDIMSGFDAPAERIVALGGLAEAQLEQRKWADAEVQARRGLASLDQLDDPDLHRLAQAWLQVVLGRARLEQGDRSEGERLIRRGHAALAATADDNKRLYGVAEAAMRALDAG